jgi:hypothetical protein
MWYWQVWEGGRSEEREEECSKEANKVISSVQVKLHDIMKDKNLHDN